MNEGELVLEGAALVKSLVDALTPVIRQWIEGGNVNALRLLRAIVPPPAALAELDRALEEAQLQKARQELGGES